MPFYICDIAMVYESEAFPEFFLNLNSRGSLAISFDISYDGRCCRIQSFGLQDMRALIT